MNQIANSAIEILNAFKMVFNSKLSGNSGRPTRLLKPDDKMPMSLFSFTVFISITVMQTANKTVILLNFSNLFRLGFRIENDGHCP